MNRMLILAATTLALVGCTGMRQFAHRNDETYEKPPFYAK